MMDPIKTMQAWMRDYELVSTDIKLSRDATTGPNVFAYTMTGFIQPKCKCADVTSIDSGDEVREFIRTTFQTCLVHSDPE